MLAERTSEPKFTVICFLRFHLIPPAFTWPETTLKVSLVAEPGMSHPVSRPLQPGIRFFQPRNPVRPGSALRLSCPEGDGTGFPRSAWLILWVT